MYLLNAAFKNKHHHRRMYEQNDYSKAEANWEIILITYISLMCLRNFNLLKLVIP